MLGSTQIVQEYGCKRQPSTPAIWASERRDCSHRSQRYGSGLSRRLPTLLFCPGRVGDSSVPVGLMGTMVATVLMSVVCDWIVDVDGVGVARGPPRPTVPATSLGSPPASLHRSSDMLHQTPHGANKRTPAVALTEPSRALLVPSRSRRAQRRQSWLADTSQSQKGLALN